MSDTLWNLPNKITLARLILSGVVLALLALCPSAEPQGALALSAFVLFVVAASTDFLDGYYARKLNQVTALGRILDPFVDKVLVTGTLIVLMRFPLAQSYLPAWGVAVIVAREFFVTALRGHAEASGVPFPADRLGKWKMVAQTGAAAGLVLRLSQENLLGFLDTVVLVLVWTAVALTAISGANYAWKARPILQA
ncbi:MAG: CDP-diacylglycerol--glycerol-3-phosphate 3-phosphatidyltransferase [Planctomycetota bacterium]